MIEAELHVIGGKHAGQVIPLNRRKFLIGRESDCQLRPNSELVSRHHCVFGIDEYSVRLRDLGSTNGTTVNGERIVKETTLVAGDRVVVGNLEFEFRVLNPTSGSSDETVVSNTETVMEIASPADGQQAPTPAPVPPDQTPPPPGATQQIGLPLDQPQPSSGDTTVIAQQPMMPGQAPYQPMMPQPMGFPGQVYGGYPYQPQPPMPMYPQGYPQQPMMPGQVPGYPQQAGQPAPAPPAADPASADPGAAAPSAEVSLPDPSETGVSEEPSKKQTEAQQGSGGSGGGDDGDSTTAAADIIRQYTQRRPG